jgi:dipeptidyl-peptidase-4
MKKLLFSLGCLCLALSSVSAQQRNLTIKEATMMRAGGISLSPDNLSNLTWLEGSDEFTYNASKAFWRENANRSGKDTLFSLWQLNTALSKAGLKSLKSLPTMLRAGSGRAMLRNGNDFYIYNYESNKIELFNSTPESADDQDEEQVHHWVAYTLDNDLWISPANTHTDQKEPADIQITKDGHGSMDIVNGKASARNEFGIDSGTFWSPDSKKLAFYRIDQSRVSTYPILDISTRPGHDSLFKYPMAGMQSQHTTLGVYDIASRKTIFLKTEGDPEQYLTNVTWSPDGQKIYIAVLNRDQNHLWLNRYDANSGLLEKTLFEETNPKYVEPLDKLIFLNGHPDQFLWLSQRDGYKHIYLYNTDGRLISQLTKGDWVVTGYLGNSADGKTFYYTSNEGDPTGQYIYSVDLKGHRTRLSSSKGFHTGKFAFSFKKSYIVDNYSAPSLPRKIDILNEKGRILRNVLTASNPLKNFLLGETRILSLKAADNTTILYGRLILPPDFDQNKKYPVIVYVYGGPHVQLVTNSWLSGSNLWMQYMAEKGYIVFTLDSRGSWNRGQAFESATFRQLGTVEMADQLEGVKYLRSLPYVDTARMGVHGWSFGGFMTNTLMLRAPGIFKVGVAGGPVIDWRYYEVMYTERYMDRPQQNPEGYEKAALPQYIGNLKGRLLLIHGTWDDVVVWQHSLMMIKESVDKDVQVDYFVYPGHHHNVIGPDRVHLMEKITLYFDDFLK